MNEKITSRVIKIGDSAIFDDYKILILFGEQVPQGVDEISVIHRFDQPFPKDYLQVGSKIIFNNHEFVIEEIGDVANETLHDLGHASLYFGLDDDTDLLPGSILLAPYELPDVSVDDEIIFVR